jgi:hypothetical protein
MNKIDEGEILLHTPTPCPGFLATQAHVVDCNTNREKGGGNVGNMKGKMDWPMGPEKGKGKRQEERGKKMGKGEERNEEDKGKEENGK